MFDISFKGANCVVISTKKSTLVADPKLSLVGLKDANVKDAVEIVTEERFIVASDDVKLIIDGPGEYEVGDFTLKSVSATRHIDAESSEQLATIYHIEVGDVKLALLGNIAAKLDDDQLEALGVVDILLLPVGGGGYTLDAVSATALVRQIEPKVVIPLHYADNDLKFEVPQDSLELFTKELGAPVEVVDKYKLKSAAVIPAALTIVNVTRS
ncbi:MAG TPA: MBL fold metallo-hydrolase [Candidatus Saccharimonadaceae bacterium]|nr:MBL fold metallo-hydrolase [Candidatus Saccharimonadaceae bacterium]